MLKITKFLPIILALYLMLLPSYYAQNYAGIIGSSLMHVHIISTSKGRDIGGRRAGLRELIISPSKIKVHLTEYNTLLDNNIP